jgi:hypothetical protein
MHHAINICLDQSRPNRAKLEQRSTELTVLMYTYTVLTRLHQQSFRYDETLKNCIEPEGIEKRRIVKPIVHFQDSNVYLFFSKPNLFVAQGEDLLIIFTVEFGHMEKM